ncbi:hypothetical protein FOA52_013271 [Chlamydomonas sp. UWO 241]|nr:hypothetical protein FOA52_013271 [Chlamydomonas sp. UWO 241]
MLAIYPLDKIAFSFNGGKDSTVLLHLLRLATRRAGLDEAGFRSFYFVREDDFEELDKFVREGDARYALRMQFLTNQDFKKGLVDFISETGTQAIVLGTRRGDPNARDQDFFCPSSDGWPPFMRVNPILDWSYHDVWTFLRTARLPYCSLYDQGYTSLGSRATTRPNRALQRDDGSYAPAYLLPDGRLERAARGAADAASSSSAVGAFTHTAGIVVVGDELLSGKIEDTNTPFLCAELHSIGWAVKRVVMVPDDMDSIANEVRQMSKGCELVITTGGVGPTLDDVTMAGVARALDKQLVRDPGLESRIRSFFGDQIGPAHLKMADLPEGEAELLDYRLPGGEMSKWPVVRCRNIYVLPGVPHLLHQKWGAIKGVLTGRSDVRPFRNQTFRLSIGDEAAIAEVLEAVAHLHSADVQIGSYPVVGQDDGAQIILSLDSKLQASIDAAARDLRALLPLGSIIREESDVRCLLRKVSSVPGHMSPVIGAAVAAAAAAAAAAAHV